jgi:hypothetical protein
MLLSLVVLTFVLITWQQEALGTLDSLTQSPELLLQVTKAISTAFVDLIAAQGGGGGLGLRVEG